MGSTNIETPSLEFVYASLTLEEDNEHDLIIEEANINHKEEDFKFMLLGKLLTNKPVKFNLMKETLASIWGLGNGMSVKEVSSNLFLF